MRLRFKLSRRGLHPILAAVLLLAVTVAAGAFVYNAFFSQASSASKAAAVAITHVELNKGDVHCMFSITVKNVGNQQIDWCNVHIWGEGGWHKSWGIGAMEPGVSRGGSWMVDHWNFTLGRSYAVQVDFGTPDGGYYSTSTTVVCTR